LHFKNWIEENLTSWFCEQKQQIRLNQTCFQLSDLGSGLRRLVDALALLADEGRGSLR